MAGRRPDRRVERVAAILAPVAFRDPKIWNTPHLLKIRKGIRREAREKARKIVAAMEQGRALIRFHPHYVGINQMIGPIRTYRNKDAFIRAAVREARRQGLRNVKPSGVNFYHCTEPGWERDASDAFKEFKTKSGFSEVYSVLIKDQWIGYSDRSYAGL